MTKFAEIMTAGGWTNVSSNLAIDFNVWRSSGEDGNKNLVFQMRELSAAGTNSILTTNYSQASVRLVGGYTAGAAGTAGTFARSAGTESWIGMNLVATAATTILPTHVLTLKYHVNKNRIMIGIEPPSATGILPNFIYIGLPDIQYCTESNSRGLIFGNTYVGIGANAVYVTDLPDESGSNPTSISRALQYQVASKNPNVAGKYFKSDIYIENINEGTRFKLDGLYILPQAGVLHGDILTEGNSQFQVYISGLGTTGFIGTTANCFALQIV